ncbi:MAG: sigma-70 family RNA polymerase sigma factor [Thermoleophilia bacterium]
MALATTARAERPPGLGRGTRDELIVQNMGLVEGLARRYVAAGEPMDDVVQAGMIGLIKAADRFDPARGDFRSFAAPTILGEIRRHFRDHSWAVNVTRGVKDDAVVAVGEGAGRRGAHRPPSATPTRRPLAHGVTR